MENWQVALIVILAIVAGVMIPAIIQFQLAMRSIHRFVRDNERDARVAFVEMNRLAAHINRLGSVVEANSKQIQSFFNSLEDVGQSVRRLRGAIRTASLLGAAVAPAIASAVKAKMQEGGTDLVAREHKLNGAAGLGEEKQQ